MASLKVGDVVQMESAPKGSKRTYEIQTVERNGMVTVNGLTGMFAQHIFVLADPKVSRSDVDEFARRVRGPKP